MKTFLAVFNAFPAILQAILAVETAVPLPKSGQQKLNLVLGVAGIALEVAQAEQQIPKGNTLTAIQAIANLSVATLNAVGTFKSTAPVSSN